MADNKGISVIVPVYNVEDYLKNCLSSVSKQSFKDLEIICVLDAKSDDGSEKILKNFKKEDNRIKIIKDTTGKGQGYNRNLGIEAATKEYIGFVDADDYIEKDFYERLYDFGQNFDADIVQTESMTLQPSGSNIPGEDNKYHLTFCYNAAKALTVIKDRFCWDKIYRSKILKDNIDIRFLETTFFEDAYFLLKALIRCNKLVIVPGSHYFHINHADSLSSKLELEPKQIDDANIVMNQIIDIISRMNGSKEENKTIIKFMVEKFGIKALQSNKYRDNLTAYIEKFIKG